MKKFGVMAILFAVSLGFSSAYAQSAGTPVFDNLPSVLPGNVPSQGFQCCGTAEVGDEIKLEVGTPRRANSTTVLMSSWSLRADYPSLGNAGYTHPITLNIYKDAASAQAHLPVKSVTQSFLIPWRPVADPTCPNGTAWRSSVDNKCYNGFAFTIMFDLRPLNYDLPSQFIYGVEYNTNTWGYNPLGVPGPYESLNVGTSNVNGIGLVPSVGTDVDPDVVYWNTVHGDWYSDGGAGGSGTLRADYGWAGYPIGVKFTTASVPTSTASCKNGAWQNLVRGDFSAFKNQGDCVSYVASGK